MKSFLEYLRCVSPRAIIFSAVVLVLLIGFVDFLTGPEISLSIFYLVPVSLVTWFLARNSGIALSVLSGAIKFTADILMHPGQTSPVIPFWNSIVMVGILLIVTQLI